MSGSSGDAAVQRASTLFLTGKRQEAIALLRGVVNRNPADPSASDVLCGMLVAVGESAQALFIAQRAADLNPRDPRAHLLLSSILLANAKAARASAQHRDAALRSADRARELAPGSFQVQQKVLDLYLALDRADLAEHHAREIWKAHPGDRNAGGIYSGALQMLSRIEEALEVSRQLRPDAAGLSWQCMHINYIADAQADEVVRVHTEAGRLISAGAPATPPAFNISRDPGRRLRVGYLSQDFRNRSVGHFMEPILRAHDRKLFEPFLYYSGTECDSMTGTLHGLAAGFAMVQDLSDADLAARFRADRIDIGVDLTGHTGLNRLAVFSHHPAPVSITYMGYPNTTGLPGMQYRIVDSITDPPGSERWATEELLRLDPCFLCYAPPAHAPPVSPPPCSTTSGITFGTFNFMPKITPVVLDLWARLLIAVPGSRLVLKNRRLELTAVRERLTQDLSVRGIDPARLTLWAEVPGPDAHLGAYANMDIALDTFPYNGTTTTVEALLMGVPVVTMMGDSHRARVSASLLTATGHPELIAKTPDDYIRIGAALADDRERLSNLRNSLRSDLLASSLCDGPGFTRRLESIYRDAWRKTIQRLGA